MRLQDCPKVINSMKYFCENAPQYHVACAGSLLGIALAKTLLFRSVRSTFMQIDPMTFNEFSCLPTVMKNLAQYLEQVDTLNPSPTPSLIPLYEKLKCTMSPVVCRVGIDVDGGTGCFCYAGSIIRNPRAYERDFAKHPNLSEFPKISMIWKSIPVSTGKRNKFIYKVVKEGARAREYENALQWLVDARLVHKIYRSSAPCLPIAAYDDLSAFKNLSGGCGVACRLAQLAPAFWRRQPSFY